ncbi:Y-family DNA polymerase [Agreia pratensis]|uniref:DNA polymerase-4 n=1 Tax=Agreia pratensis TaxID=150121 RepID=A0A1X7J841_9MICO|nr:DNA polymerase IV [Agreia pratensis]SMG23915.1 DNA polymerase-4 [Agreia pratensis]
MATSLLLHVDADSFFASVILRHRPELVDRPMAAIAHVFIASANYPARLRGVRGGMQVHEAQHLCPELVMIETPRDEVEEVSDALFDIFRDSARAVEPGSMEEAFLDIGTTDIRVAVDAAQSLRRRVARELGIPISVGIGRTKLMAKLASRAAKPDGLHVIDDAEAAELRISLPISDIWGIGAQTVERLRLIEVAHLADLDRISPEELRRVCGAGMAHRLDRIRAGTDDATLNPVETRSSLSSEGTISGYNRPDWTPSELLEACVTRVCGRASKADLAAGGLTVALRFDGGDAPVILKHRMPSATSDPRAWLPEMLRLLAAAQQPGLIAVKATLTALVPPERVQQTLF